MKSRGVGKGTPSVSDSPKKLRDLSFGERSHRRTSPEDTRIPEITRGPKLHPLLVVFPLNLPSRERNTLIRTGLRSQRHEIPVTLRSDRSGLEESCRAYVSEYSATRRSRGKSSTPVVPGLSTRGPGWVLMSLNPPLGSQTKDLVPKVKTSGHTRS